MAKKLNKNMVLALTAVGFLLTTAAGILMVYSFQEKDPADFEAKAKEFAASEDWNRAALYYRKAYNVSEDPVYLVRAGNMLYEQGEEGGALGFYQSAVNINPTLMDAQEKILDLMLELAQNNPGATRQWTELISVADAILAIEDQVDHPKATNAKGLGLIRTKDLDPRNKLEGKKYLDRAVELSPDNVEFVRSLASYYAEEGQVDKAAEIFEAFIKTANDPGENAAKSRCYYANYLRTKEEYDAAIKTLDDALRLAGDDPEVIAFVHQQIGMFWTTRWSMIAQESGPEESQAVEAFDKAAAALRKSIDVEPEGYSAYLRLAELLKLNRKYDEAIEVCKSRLDGPANRRGIQASITKVSMYLLYIQLAEIKVLLSEDLAAGSKERAEQLGDAEMDVQAALSEIQRGAEAQYWLGRIRYSEGKDREAMQFFERSDELSSPRIDPINLYYLSQARMRQGLNGAAKDAIVKSLAARNAPLACWLQYAKILLALDKPAEARDQADYVLQRSPGNPDAMLIKAAALQELGQSDEAQQMLEGVKTDRPLILAAKAVSKAQSGDPEGALADLMPLLEDNPADGDLVRGAVSIYQITDRLDDANRLLDAAVAKTSDPYPFELMRLQISESLTNDQKLERQLELIQSGSDEYVKAFRMASYIRSQEPEAYDKQMEQYKKAKSLIEQGASEAAKSAGERGIRAIIGHMFDLAVYMRDEAELETIIKEAESHNVDGADGLSFRGRRMVLEGILLEQKAADEQDDSLRADAKAKYEDAINVLMEALDRYPTSALTHAALGDAYYQTDRFNEAKIAYERADDISPDNARIVRQLAILAMRAGDDATFNARIEQAQQLIPEDPWVKQQNLRMEEAKNPKEGIAKREAELEKTPDDVGNLTSLIQLYRQVGEAEKCQQAVEKLLAVQTDLQTIAFSSDALRQVGKAGAALNHLRQFLRDAPAEDKATAQLLIGEHFQRLRNFGDAEAAFLAAADIQPTTDVCVAIASYYFEMRQYPKAKTWYDRAYESTEASAPQRAALRRAQVETLLRLDEPREAQKLISDYAATYPDDPYPLFYEAQIAATSGKVDEALTKLGRFIEQKPRDALARYHRAQYLAGRGDWQQSISDLEDLKAIDPKALNYAPRVLLSRAYAMGDREDLSIQELQIIIESDPDATPIAEELINQHIAAKRFIEAEKVITAMINRHPGQTRWLIRSADLARSQYEEAEKQVPPNQGQMQHHRSTAVRDLKKAVNMSGFDESATYRLLAVLLNMNAVDEGVQFFDDQVPPNRKSGSLLRIYARLLAKKGDIAAAADSFRFALLKTEYKSMDDQLEMIGDIMSTFGMDAPKVFEERPSNPGLARANDHIRALICMAIEQGDKSIEICQKLLEDVKTDAEKTSLLFRIALVHDGAGDYDKALEYYEKVLAIDDEYGIALNNLAYLLTDKLNKPTEAIEYAKQAAALKPEANILDTLGWAYVMAGQLDEGIGKLFQARQMDSSHAPSTYHLAEAYRMSGDFDDAIKLLTEVVQATKQVEGRKNTWAEYHELAIKALDKAKNGDSN